MKNEIRKLVNGIKCDCDKVALAQLEPEQLVKEVALLVINQIQDYSIKELTEIGQLISQISPLKSVNNGGFLFIEDEPQKETQEEHKKMRIVKYEDKEEPKEETKEESKRDIKEEPEKEEEKIPVKSQFRDKLNLWFANILSLVSDQELVKKVRELTSKEDFLAARNVVQEYMSQQKLPAGRARIIETFFNEIVNITDQLKDAIEDKLTDEQEKILKDICKRLDVVSDEELERICREELDYDKYGLNTAQKKKFEETVGLAIHERFKREAIAKSLGVKEDALRNVKISEVPAGSGMVIGVGDNGFTGLGNDSGTSGSIGGNNNAGNNNNNNDDDEEDSEGTELYANMNVKLRQGGRKAPKGGAEKLELIGDDLYSWLDSDNPKAAKVLEDISKYHIDLENNDWFDVSCNEEQPAVNTTKHGIDYMAAYAGGDWQWPVLFFIYWDGSNYRGYVPLKGNAINPKTKAAFGDDEELDKKFCRENNLKYYDNLEEGLWERWNIEACLEDFEARLEVR